jgi:pimeloyl-ACP methyl ester carboxylesterase
VVSVPDPTSVLVDGPWRHRDVSANGTRLHVTECGDGPLVLLLHGFPEFWWTWRHQLPALAERGLRAVAPDLRGYGASDKPPRGYDAITLARDIAGLVKALGERDAVIVGNDWGGLLGWTLAALHPNAVRRLLVLSTPHPLRLRQAMLAEPRRQLAASGYVAGFQLPWRPERRLVADGAALVGRLLREWGGPGFPDVEAELRYRDAARIPGVAHSSLEYYRWMVRSLIRPDGARYARAVRHPITAPTLHLHGAKDTCMLPGTGRGSGRYVSGPYAWRLLPDVGHYPQEEAPEEVTDEIVRWAGS